VLCHTDLQRTKGESLGMSLSRVNWGNYDLVVIDESHNFRNNQAYKEKETRYQTLMNRVIRSGVKTKVLMLSATPVNNKFSDLKNQLALAYEGDSATLHKQLDTHLGIDEIFKRAQKAFNNWAELEPEKRTATALLAALDFDFFRLLDSVTIARSRRHIQTFYDTKDIGRFPTRNKPLSFQPPLTQHAGVIGFNEIFEQLSGLRLAVYAPVSYILPSRMAKSEAMYDTNVQGGKSRLRQADREKALQRLMTINLLKRLESSVEAFRLTLKSLHDNHTRTLSKIDSFRVAGDAGSVSDWTDSLANLEAEEDDIPVPDDAEIGGKVKINLADMDLPSWEHDLKVDLEVINALLESMAEEIYREWFVRMRFPGAKWASMSSGSPRVSGPKTKTSPGW